MKVNHLWRTISEIPRCDPRSRKSLLALAIFTTALVVWHNTAIAEEMITRYRQGPVTTFQAAGGARFRSRISPESKTVGDKFWNGTFRDVTFEYLLQPNEMCSPTRVLHYVKGNGEVDPIIIFVLSKPAEFEERDVVRSTWATVHVQNAKVIFCLGLAKSETEQAWVDKEATRQGDILQFKMTEAYSNLAYKTYFVLNWVAWHCRKDSFIMKTDTDTIVWLKGLAKLRENNQSVQRTIWGACAPKGGSPLRSGKWKVTYEQYNSTKYPAWCSGTGYVMSGDVPIDLVEAAKYQDHYFPLEDVMFNGIAAERVGNISRRQTAGFHSYGSPKKCAPDVITHHLGSSGHRNLEKAWMKYLCRCET